MRVRARVRRWRSTTLVPSALALSLALLACTSERDEWLARYDEIRAQADRDARAIPLPVVEDSLPAPVPDRARLRIVHDSVTLDASPTTPRDVPTGATVAEQTAALPPAPRVVARLGGSEHVALSASMIDPQRLTGLELWSARDVEGRQVLEIATLLATSYGVRRVSLRVVGAGAAGIVDLDVTPPMSHAPDSGVLGLEVTVLHDGLRLSGTGGTLAASCTDLGPDDAVTVPGAATAVDGARLVTCLGRVRREFPDDPEIGILAAPGVPFERVARAVAAIAASDLGYTEIRPRITTAHVPASEDVLMQATPLDRIDAALAPGS